MSNCYPKITTSNVQFEPKNDINGIFLSKSFTSETPFWTLNQEKHESFFFSYQNQLLFVVI